MSLQLRGKQAGEYDGADRRFNLTVRSDRSCSRLGTEQSSEFLPVKTIAASNCRRM
ncbi:hypothetical protein [Stieleria neptunia]|uniref:hypothetical protein n=1 Tax=Stieleria neptunia TaxID=2527979 RepID=UPI0018D24B09|nr:hypothetical protein [Stieleria neptunia]